MGNASGRDYGAVLGVTLNKSKLNENVHTEPGGTLTGVILLQVLLMMLYFFLKCSMSFK